MWTVEKCLNCNAPKAMGISLDVLPGDWECFLVERTTLLDDLCASDAGNPDTMQVLSFFALFELNL